MAQDEQISVKSKNISNKQKKVPQRGLGVAQLEKIRIEEQRKKEALQAANLFAKNAIQSTNFRPNSVPLPPLSSSQTNFEILNRNSVQNTKQLLDSGRGEIVNWPNRLWNGELNVDGEKQRVDHLVFGFGRQVNLPYESNSSVLPMRSHQFQPPSSMVNASSMEPPSNQSFRGNNHTSSWPEEDKIVGTKRSYPFSLESPRGHSRSRSDDLANAEPRNKFIIRDGTSNSSPLPEMNIIEVIRDDEKLNGDLLKLGPPVASSPPLNSKDKQSSNFSGHNGTELSDFKCFHGQENVKSQSFWWGPCRSTEQQAFSFFPDKPRTDQTMIARVGNSNGEKAETIDLNLKL